MSIIENVDDAEPDSTSGAAQGYEEVRPTPTPGFSLGEEQEVTSTETSHWCSFPETSDPPTCPQCGGKPPTTYDEEDELTETDNDERESLGTEEEEQEEDEQEGTWQRDGVRPVTRHEVIINQDRDTIRLPNDVNQAYLATEVQGDLIQVTLLGTMPNQYWCVIRVGTTQQKVAYPDSILTLRMDMLGKVVESVAGMESPHFNPKGGGAL